MSGFGSALPWAEPSWYSGRPSPYYNDSHRRLREAVRRWTEENVSGNIEDWEAAGKIPDSVYQKCARDGLLLPLAFGSSIPKEFAACAIIGGIKAEQWDGFHDSALWDELVRGGAIASIFIGLTVGTPPLIRYGSSHLRGQVLPGILSGEKKICLAITEPSGGSDVRNLTTTAEKTADGKYYIVNGEKKISGNRKLIVTGGPGVTGISLLLIPRSEGIRTRPLSVTPGNLSATTYISFEDVRVPVENLVGIEGSGFKYIMNNFNHERLWIVFQALRGSRIAIQDAMTWALKREAFGTTLIEQPVVRHKFGLMAKEIEALQAWTEQIIFELDNLSHDDGNRLLGGVTALLKVKAGMVAKLVADECVKIMGGLGLTKTGQGARIESFARATASIVIPGGAEDVLIDLGVREALKLTHMATGRQPKV
ncbi:acyl-CoA dehydrogenase/oxidase [Aspergillus pseudoustus]|uniref:Acyl-CoA dehydrogenase/oxidase n=1 Tax=Aspergillus pseudoustus TaxID=1810923 RepID=A0ABR4KEC2_9EURO